ncbi:ABC transporter ATP-binding protein [Nonomuraea sp. K274]|uniref:ABC transporter ATP-binding protein n=1 Tax=Nonomuraea cypriaca TaxID=1187855 RepID=A0A931F591_9ACTN|nr:ABC transporter ATP-binding protein [Nonomuraea cypriaca]MBF8191828.1 ABC transporter ATP-binding protein [Nonomuraea cypriaca]
MSEHHEVLAIRDLTVRYGRAGTPPAVDSVSIDVSRREIVGVVGESGSGKTSIGMVAAGLWPATGGSVTIEGRPISPRMPRRDRALVQMAFQDPNASFDPRQSVRGGLRELRRLHKERTGWISDEDLLRRVGLDSVLLGRLPHQLSGGQAQRIAVARALLLRPKLLIADEPTSALDVSVQAQILDLLRALCRDEDLSILFISHDLAVVRSLCRRVYVMRHGQVVESGSTDEVMAHPRHEYTVKLLAAIPGNFGNQKLDIE